MKKSIAALSLAFLLPFSAQATTLIVAQGGTGSTTLSGILSGNGTAPIQTVNIGSGLNYSGNTLSATGGGSGTVSSSLQGYNAFYNANGTVVSGTSTIFTSQSSLVSISTTTNSDANGNNALTVQGAPGTDVLNLTDGIARFGFYIKNNSIVAPIQMGSITNQDYGFFTNNGSPQLTLRTNGNNGFGTSTSPNRLTVQAAGATNYLTSGAASTFFVDTGTNNYAAEFKGNGANYTGFLVTNTTSTGAPFVQFDNTANSKLWTIMEENTNNFSVREGSATGPQDLTIAAGGNIGISSTTPGSLLSIGTTNGINITPTATSTFNNAIRSTCFSTDGTTCLTSGGGGGSSTDHWATSSLSTNLIYPNSAQMAALGTTSAQAMFTVSNNTIVNNTSLVDIGATNASPYNLRLFRYDVPGALTQYFFDNSGNLVERNTSTTAGLQFGTNGNTRLTIDANGNAGVGTTTPGARLDVTSASTAGTASGIRLLNPNISTGSGSAIDFYSGNGNTNARIYNYAVNTNAGQLRFATANGSGFVDAMTILNTGNVGIASSSPMATLSVVGTTYLQPTGSSDIGLTVNTAAGINVIRTLGNGNPRVIIGQGTPDPGTNLEIHGNSGNGTTTSIYTVSSNKALAIVGATGQTADLLNINSIGGINGNLLNVTAAGLTGIGSSTPFTRFVVGGNSYLGGNVTATGTLQLPALATAAGSILAVDGSGFVISTTSPPATVTSGTSQPVKYATTGALPSNTYLAGVITEVGNGALSVDGASPAVADRVLVKNEATAANNGIYTVTAAGSGIAAFVLTRATDYNSSTNIYPGIATYVISGSANSDSWWAMTSSAPITVGTTALNYTESSGGVLSAGTGITISGTTVSVNQAFTPTWSGLHTFTGGILGNNATSTITNLVMVNSTSTNATTTNLAIASLATSAGSILAVNPNGQVIATTSPLSNIVSLDNSLLPSTATGLLSLTVNTAHINNWGVTQNFSNITTANATGSNITANLTASSTNLYVSSLGNNAAGSFLAVDPAGKVIATTTPSSGSTNFSKEFFPLPALPYVQGLSGNLFNTTTLGYVGMVNFPVAMQVNKVYAMVQSNAVGNASALLKVGVYDLSGNLILNATSSAIGTVSQGVTEHSLLMAPASTKTINPGQYYVMIAVSGAGASTNFLFYSTSNTENGATSGWASTALPMTGTYPITSSFIPGSITPSSISTSTDSTTGVIRFDN